MTDTIVLQDGDAYLVRVTEAGKYRHHALMIGNYCVGVIRRWHGAWRLISGGAWTPYEDLDIALRDMWQLREDATWEDWRRGY